MSSAGSLGRVLLGGAGILAVYLLILAVAPGDWGRLLLPNGWLLLSTALALRGRTRAVLTGANRPAGGAVVVVASAAVLVVFVAWWPLGTGSLDGHAPWLVLVLAGAVPLAEELYFRGLLLPALAEAWGGALATVLVSALFAFLHLPQGLLLPMGLLSVALCVLALLTRTALWSVGVHLAWNAAAMAREIAPGPQRWQLALAAVATLTALVWWGLRTGRTGER